jgi:ribosomal protein S20
MANTPQSEKRARQAQARYAVNKMRRSRIRTFLRKVEEAIASGDNAAARAALQAARPDRDAPFSLSGESLAPPVPRSHEDIHSFVRLRHTAAT